MSADEATVTHVLQLMALQNKVYENRAATIDTEVDPESVAQKRISYVENSKAGTVDEEGNETELTEEELAEKKEQMEAVLAEAKAGGDLEAAAQAHEMSASSITYGKDSTSLDEAVFAAADALVEGEFSELIETEDYYYIVYMESTFDEEATETARENELSQREREAYDAWYQPLVESAEITTNEEALETLTFERIFREPEAEAEDAAAEETEDTVSGDTADEPEGEAQWNGEKLRFRA